MTPTTPSPISDQPAGELLRKLHDRIRLMPRSKQYISGQQYSYVALDDVLGWIENAMKDAVSTAPTTGSAPVAYMHRNAGPWDLSFADDEGKLREVHTKAIPLYDTPPASPAASVLTDEQIMAIYYAQVACVEKHPSRTLIRDFGRALLAASMGGEKA